MPLQASSARRTRGAAQFFGTWPPAKDLTLSNLVVARITDTSCSGLTPATTGKTVIVTNPEACAGEVLTHLLAALKANSGAIFVSRHESGDVANLYNWELTGEVAVDVPLVVGVPASWGTALTALSASVLAASSVRVNVAVTTVQRDVNVFDGCLYGHANFYNHQLATDAAGPLTITVTPTFGDPDVYVRAVSGGTFEPAAKPAAAQRGDLPLAGERPRLA